jgi:hypothetical protein
VLCFSSFMLIILEGVGGSRHSNSGGKEVEAEGLQNPSHERSTFEFGSE